MGIALAGQAQFPADFFQEEVGDFTLPVGVEFDSRGYSYVWEKGGKVWVLDSNDMRLPQPLIDLSAEVASWRDHGLLGFALDPDFLFNGYFYCLYTVDRHHLYHYGTPSYSPDSSITNQATIGRITRFTANPASDFTQAPYSSRNVLLGKSVETGIPIPNNLHGIGSLAFGDDGSLLASTGDGGPDVQPEFAGDFHIEQALADGIITPPEHVGPFRAQIVECLNGKILRIDPATGDGLVDNPFFNPAAPRANRSRVWTLGIRNPFRMEVIQGTGAHEPGQGNPGIIVFGDVGEGKWEEINFIAEPGLNCGWPIYEGISISSKWAGVYRQNQFAPNPLLGTDGCTKAFYDFQDLLLPADSDNNYYWPNPCQENQAIGNERFRFSHHWPVLDYSNQLFNQPSRARTAIFDKAGKKKISSLSNPDASVSGEEFDGFSAMAGFWYPGGAFPEQYHRTYWIADYSGWIKVLKLDEAFQLTQVDSFCNLDLDLVDLAFNPHNQSIYYVDLSEGKLIRIVYGLNPPPVPVLARDTFWGPSPLSIDFDASASFHPKDLPFSYHWDFGDGSTASLGKVSHTFVVSDSKPSSFEVNLTLTDSLGKSAEKKLLVSVNNSPPQAKITSISDGQLYPISSSSSLPLIADVSDPEHSASDLNYQWVTFLHHNVHFHPEPADTNQQTYTLIDPLGCLEELYYFRIRLEVRDPMGLSAADEVRVYPNCQATGVAVDLAAEPREQSVVLSWNLEEIDGMQNIEVQRVTSKAENWDIGEVVLNGVGNYTFEDKQPENGINYYRLKLNREDGTYDYSNFVNIIFPKAPELKVFPNPAVAQIHLQITDINGQDLTWRIVATDGTLLKAGSFETTQANYLLQQIDVSNLQTGWYLLELSIGENAYTEKVFIRQE